MSKQADRDALAKVLARVIPHANWCDYDEKTAEGCQPGFGCNVHAERAHIAEVVLASDWLAQRDRRVAAGVLREAAKELPARTEGTDRSGTATWRPHDRDVYSLAIEEAQSALRERADRIEAGDV